MAKKLVRRPAKPVPIFSLGDRVEIINFGRGEITELRGALGPGRAQVYRVMYRRKPTAGFIEVLGSQLKPSTVIKRSKPAKTRINRLAGTSR